MFQITNANLMMPFATAEFFRVKSNFFVFKLVNVKQLQKWKKTLVLNYFSHILVLKFKNRPQCLFKSEGKMKGKIFRENV